MESLATQTLVLFVIRIVGRPWTNRPSLPLTVTILLVVVIGLVLPYSPAADRLGLRSLPLTYFLFLSIAVTTYLVSDEAVKKQGDRRLLPN